MRWFLLALCAIFAGAFAAAGDPASGSGSERAAGGRASSPFLSLATLRVLERVNALYPSQTLGVVHVSGRAFLMSSSAFVPDPEVLREARAGHSAEDGITLSAEIAERYGLVRTAAGEVVLAAGSSVYLVDPRAPEIVVEIKAREERGLVLSEIAALGARLGIYAGLSTAREGADTALRGPNGKVIFIAAPRTPVSPETARVADARRDVGVGPMSAHRSEPASGRPEPAVLAPDDRSNPPPVDRAAIPASQPVAPALASIQTPVAVAEAAVPNVSGPAFPKPGGSAAAEVDRLATLPDSNKARAVVYAVTPDPSLRVAARAESESYERALQALNQRQGRAWVRALSDSTRPQPSVDGLRALGFVK